MSYDPFSALTVITGPAILTNACAILQNGVTLRYNLAITQWREFHASLAAEDGRLSMLFVDPRRALSLAERRIRLQLRALELLNAGVALFGATTICGLLGDILVKTLLAPSWLVGVCLICIGSVALAVMLAAIGALFLENGCSRSMVRLHLVASATPRRARQQVALGNEA
ncbi:hypothetical protein OHD62_12560 [Mesorhizobium sp. YC-39]|uniref:hypothetical protein n=1 Tax=unclassified Mesorhizobium TaxID=325217 RepID=UPI0021E758D0|nr:MULTISPECIES: hypothetical protein [unclassified Mesorhizobium]MCV3207474.1 hypothetical protein [Mesorhizobium sp. YC-2]MCV3229201.1 hypothetical protein [Mesorhizobium sp. YC-39]